MLEHRTMFSPVLSYKCSQMGLTSSVLSSSPHKTLYITYTYNWYTSILTLKFNKIKMNLIFDL